MDRIDLKNIVEEVVGLEEITVSQDIDIVDDHNDEWVDDWSKPEVEFDDEQQQSNEQDLTNLRVLEWLNEMTSDPKETNVTIQDVDRESAKYIKTKRDDPSWAAQEGQLLIPASNLDLIPGMRSTGTPMDIFVRGVGVGLTHTENLIIKKLRIAIETEMNIRHSETYCRPSGARYLVGSALAPMCKSRYPVHFVAVDVKSTRTIVDQAFSVPKCVRLARMSEKSYELLCKMFSAIPERTKEELESILGKKFMGYVSGNFSDFEKQKQGGSTVTDYNAVDENDEIHRVMMEVEPLLEASGKRNWRSIMLTHDEFPCHCLLQTWWYPKRSNLMLIWDSGELLSMGLPDSSQPVTIVIVGVMMAIRWLEAHVRENNRQEAPTREQLRKLDCLKDLDLFETMCKVLNIPMEVKKIWARKRLMPWFRANMTAWLYEYAKKHMSKHGRVYSEYQLDIGAGAFKRAFVTHRNAVTTAVKRISRTSERSGNEKAEMLKEDLERNVTLCLHNSFCRNRESNVDPLPCCKQRVEEQKCWRTASNSVRIVNDVLQDTETESAESVSQEEEMEH